MRQDLWSVLERAERSYPRHEAVVEGEQRLTYAELVQRVRCLARGIEQAGHGRGGRLCALLPNGLEILELTFACAALGLILVPLNTRLAARELSEILRDCEPGLLIVHADLERLGREALKEAGAAIECLPARGTGGEYEALLRTDGPHRDLPGSGPDEVAQLYYTSGTTGRAKGVQLTHANVVSHAEMTVFELDLVATDRWGHFAPMFHLADAWAVVAITLVGGVHVLCPHFGAKEAFDLIARERISLTNLVPTMLNRMVHEPDAAQQEVNSLRLILSGGAPIAPELVRRIMQVFRCEYVQTYGLTETSPFLTMSLLSDDLRALDEEQQFYYRSRTGRAVRGIELRVVDEAGRDVLADDAAVGEIIVRGASVTPGYWRCPEESARAFMNGWFCTGDLATINARGFVNIVDRKKDIILTGGETVYSTEVENALAECAGVQQVAVFGIPDEDWGEVVCAALVSSASANVAEAELDLHCRANLAGFKCPRRYLFLDSLPESGSGKVLKRELRGMAALDADGA